MKKITDNQVLGELGETIAKAAFLRIGFSYDPRGRLEAGVDGIVELRDPKSGQALGKLIGVQVRSTRDGKYSKETSDGFDYLLPENDLSYWRGTNLPIIIVLYRQSDDSLYWKHVRGGAPSEPRRLLFSKNSDALDVASRDRLGELTIDRSQHGTFLPPLGKPETAVLNALRVKLPDEIFVAESQFHTGRDGIPTLLKERDPHFDWVIRGRHFYSFRDPRGTSAACLVDRDTVESIETDVLSDSDDEDNRVATLELLRRTLQKQTSKLLSYDKDSRCLFFKAQSRFRKMTYNYKASKNATKATVVSVYRDKRDTGIIKSVRHHAFLPRFEYLAGDWFVVVSPTFVFTTDGFRSHPLAPVLLSGKKRLEKNAAIRGQFLMWRHYLEEISSVNADLLTGIESAKEIPALKFEPLDQIELENSVPEEAWRRSDPNAEKMQAEIDWLG